MNGTDAVTPPATGVASGTPLSVIVQVIAASSPADAFGTAGYSQSYARVYDRLAGNYLAIGLNANQTSPAMVANIRAVVNQANVNQADSSAWMSQSAANEDQLIGGLLQLAMTEYFNEFNAGANEIAGLTQAVPEYAFVASGIATSDSVLQTTIPAATQNEMEFPYLPQNMDIDMAGNGWACFSITGDSSQNTVRDHLDALTSSVMEAEIWQELTNTPSLSTTSSLQFANQAGFGTTTISSTSQIAGGAGQHGVEQHDLDQRPPHCGNELHHVVSRAGLSHRRGEQRDAGRQGFVREPRERDHVWLQPQ